MQSGLSRTYISECTEQETVHWTHISQIAQTIFLNSKLLMKIWYKGAQPTWWTQWYASPMWYWQKTPATEAGSVIFIAKAVFTVFDPTYVCTNSAIAKGNPRFAGRHCLVYFGHRGPTELHQGKYQLRRQLKKASEPPGGRQHGARGSRILIGRLAFITACIGRVLDSLVAWPAEAVDQWNARTTFSYLPRGNTCVIQSKV